MEYVIAGDRLVAKVSDGAGDAVARDGQVIAVEDRTADWSEDYQLARIELSDAVGRVEVSAALQCLPSASDAELAIHRLLEEIDDRLT